MTIDDVDGIRAATGNQNHTDDLLLVDAYLILVTIVKRKTETEDPEDYSRQLDTSILV
jgi:hypothetical protein